MTYTPVFAAGFILERDNIIRWYEEQSQSATIKFILELNHSISKICESPFLYRSTHKRFREHKMKKYPFYIVFGINEKLTEVIFLKIYHTSRDPLKKYQHL